MRALIRHRAILSAVLLGASLLALLALPRLQFDFTPQQIFESVSDDFANREAFAQRYGREDNVLFVRVAAPDVYDDAVLARVHEATGVLSSLDEVRLAESITTVPLPRAGSDDGAMRVDPIGTDGAALRAELPHHPLVSGRLVNAAGTKTLIVAELRTDLQDVDDLRAALATTRAALEPALAGLDWELRGIGAMRTLVVDRLFEDQLTFVPVIALLYVLMLLILFRSVAGVVLPLAIVGAATLWLLGIMSAAGSTLNIINNVLPSLVFMIAVSDSIHVLGRHAEESTAPPADAVARALRHTGLACLLTSATTAVGFFSLASADSTLLREFSWQAGLGVLLAFVATIGVTAVMLPSLEPVHRVQSTGTFAPFARSVLARPRAIAAATLVGVAIAAALTSTIRIDAKLLDIFGDDADAAQVTAEIEQEFGGVLPIEISLETTGGSFADPDLYRRVDAVQRFAERAPEVLGTQSFIDFHRPVRILLLGDPSRRDELPSSAAEVEQVQLLLGESPEASAQIARFAGTDLRTARVLVRVRDVGGAALRSFSDRLDGHLRSTFADAPVRWTLTGDAYIAAHSFDAFVRDLLFSLLGAFGVIFALIALLFRSLRLAAIAMVPNLVPLLVTGAFMAVNDITLDVTSMTTFAIGLGLAVDDTIHFIARFREERTRRPTYDAIVATFAGSGRAIVTTSVLLIAGMAALQLSSFAPTVTFSTLMIVTITGALLADLIVLPPLLLLAFGASRLGVRG